MQPPLKEVLLELHFELVPISAEKLQDFYRLHDSISISPQSIKIASKRGVSFPVLRSEWIPLLELFFATFGIAELQQISLSYQNEIPIEELRSFRNYLNINFEMPETLKERVEFFRSEFTYKYSFGLIKVWLQPDWDEEMESYCVQFNLEARQIGTVPALNLNSVIHELHKGIKEVFRQILSEDYIRSLPQ